MGEVYKGTNGAEYRTGREIGRGGEGAVYEDANDRSRVIKIYTDAPTPEKAEKLLYMSSVQQQELLQYAAWPVDVVRDSRGVVHGFVMAKFEAYVPLHKLFGPMDRKKLFPDKGYNFLVHVARNLATALYKLHNMGVIVGDINEANILVNARGMIVLIDCDSFQVFDGSSYYYCDVGIARYTAPELLDRKSLANVVRTVNTDAFSIATLIFQLLFLGRAPFTGVNPSNKELDEETAIKQGEFAYSLKKARKKLYPAKNSLDIKHFPPGIVELFHRAFEQRENRPGAADWIRELDVLKSDLTYCELETTHYYPKPFGVCPWCDFKHRAGIVYFLSDSYLKGMPELKNIEEFVNGYKTERPEKKTASHDFRLSLLKANPIGEEFKAIKTSLMIVLMMMLGVTAGMVIANWLWGLLTLGVCALVLSRLTTGRKLLAEMKRREYLFKSLKAKYDALLQQYNNPALFGRCEVVYDRLQKTINLFKGLPEEYDSGKQKIEERHYQLQYEAYLTAFDINSHAIPSFGPAKKLALINNGIRTAADINRLQHTKIPGIGPANIQILLNWQRQVGAAFTYVPDQELMKGDIEKLTAGIAARKKFLETEIKDQWREVQMVKEKIRQQHETLEKAQGQLADEVYQAELDWIDFRRFIGHRL